MYRLTLLILLLTTSIIHGQSTHQIAVNAGMEFNKVEHSKHLNRISLNYSTIGKNKIGFWAKLSLDSQSDNRLRHNVAYPTDSTKILRIQKENHRRIQLQLGPSYAINEYLSVGLGLCAGYISGEITGADYGSLWSEKYGFGEYILDYETLVDYHNSVGMSTTAYQPFVIGNQAYFTYGFNFKASANIPLTDKIGISATYISDFIQRTPGAENIIFNNDDLLSRHTSKVNLFRHFFEFGISYSIKA